VDLVANTGDVDLVAKIGDQGRCHVGRVNWEKTYDNAGCGDFDEYGC
jgi:hypothetical protein